MEGWTDGRMMEQTNRYMNGWMDATHIATHHQLSEIDTVTG